MRITASIVTFNNKNEILSILSSIKKTGLMLSDVFVIDNASKDDTVDVVSDFFPDVNLIKSGTNLGYGAAHNLAINEVESDYHIIINPDITLDKDSLEKMIDFMNKNRDVVLLTPKVLNTDLTIQFLPKKKPTFRYCISGRLPLRIAKKIRAEYTMENVDINQPVEIDFCTGCFMFCRTSALKNVGGFDEAFFMYFEDADLTLRMKQFGRTVYYPLAFVIHEWKRESKTNWKLFRIHVKSMFRFLKKWKKHNDKE